MVSSFQAIYTVTWDVSHFRHNIFFKESVDLFGVSQCETIFIYDAIFLYRTFAP